MKKNTSLIIGVIIGIIILGISIKFNFTGWQWSLPNETHYYTYHPDEGINIGGAIRIFAGAKDPGFFNYSSLYFYIVAYVMSVASTFGVLNIGDTINSDTLAQLYSCGRITSLIFSVLTIVLIYWTGYRLKGLWCGIIAGLLACFAPIFVMHSKFVAVDVTCGFFVTLCVFIATFIDLQIKEFKWKNEVYKKKFLLPLILSSIASGLAMGTKYNGLIVFIVPLVIMIFALIQKKINVKDFILTFIITGACTLITFLITTPGIFINNAQFIKDFTYELHHMKIGHGDEFINTGSGFIYTIKENMLYGMGLLYTIFAIICVIGSIFTKNIYAKAMSVFAIIYYISISTGNVRFARYLIPVLPVFALLCGYIFASLMKKNLILKIICPIILLIILVPNIYYSNFYNTCFLNKESRDSAIEFCNENLKGETIAFPTVPWFFTPPFNKETSVMRQQRYEFTINNKDFNLLCEPEEENEWNVEFLKEKKPKYVMFSSIESFHKMRTHNKKYEEYMKYINENYKEEIIYFPYENSSDFIFLKKLRPTEKKYLPSDMTYLQPTIYIYKNKKY